MGCIQAKCCDHCQLSFGGETSETGVFAPDGNNSHGYGSCLQSLTNGRVGVAQIPSHNFRLQFAHLTQRGYYPDAPEKENQDSFCIQTQIKGDPNTHFFAVFDGHGQFGTQCSNFTKGRLVDFLVNDPNFSDDPVKAYSSAFLATNSELHSCDIDDSMSGTTAITVLVRGSTLFVANVGDSRAVIAVKSRDSVVAQDLSVDQTPFRKDECERVKLCGARVLTVDQLEGLQDPNVQSWGDEENDEGDPPRLWVQNGMYPGTAFTRSVGDSTAEKIGVISVPEISVVQMTQDHLFFVIASDGVFEFLTSQAVVDMVTRFKDPRDACSAIAAESYRLWLEHENRTDDITIIIVHINGLSNPGLTDGASELKAKPALWVADKGLSDRVVSIGLNPEVRRSRRGSFSNSHPPYPLDLPMEQGPKCVAPSPTHPSSFDET